MAGGCERCGGGSGLQVAGATPYVRCLAAGPLPDGSRKVGAVRIATREGHVRIDGLRAPMTLVAFSGPAFGDPPAERELEALRRARPDLVLMVGGAGDTQSIAAATIGALAELGVPVLILAGGRDSRGRIERALSGLATAKAAWITDVTTAYSVRIGGDMFVPVAGARDGRYALDDESCGYASADLDALAGKLPAGGARRWLIAWEAPQGNGDAAVARTAQGIDVGSAALAELAREIGASGGLFAWPDARVLLPSAAGDHRAVPIGGAAEPDLRMVVPRLTGAAIERSDGSRVEPGFAVLELGAGGMRVVAVHAAH